MIRDAGGFMGLDTVELVIEVEKAFDIAILDADAERIATVGQLYEFVLAKLPLQQTTRCPSAAGFYRFRRALIAQFGVDRQDVHPARLVAQLVPVGARRSSWQRLGERLEWRLPSLVRPAWMIRGLQLLVLSWLAAVISSLGWAGAFSWGAFSSAIAVWFLSSILLSCAAFRLTVPFATEFPRDCVTVREMVQSALGLNYDRIKSKSQGWDRQEVWECLRAIIVTQLGVAPEDVVESASFVNDFGAG
jgi:acyl carrier protein